MGKMTILSKSSNNSYSYVDNDDAKLAVNGNFELDEQEKKILSANGNITYDGAYIANFSTSMYNGVLQYQLTGATMENTTKAFTALSGVQEQLTAQIAPADTAASSSSASSSSSSAPSDSGTDKSAASSTATEEADSGKTTNDAVSSTSKK